MLIFFLFFFLSSPFIADVSLTNGIYSFDHMTIYQFAIDLWKMDQTLCWVEFKSSYLCKWDTIRLPGWKGIMTRGWKRIKAEGAELSQAQFNLSFENYIRLIIFKKIQDLRMSLNYISLFSLNIKIILWG